MVSDLSFWERLQEAGEAALPNIWAVLGGGVIATVFAVMTGAHRKWRNKWWARWLGRLTTNPGRIHMFWAILLVGVLYACFETFDLVNVENHKIHSDIAQLSEPEFRIESEGTLLTGDDRPGSIHVLLWARAANLGAPGAIVASSWRFHIRLINGSEFVAFPTTISETERYCRDSGHVQVFEPSDQLSLRASRPIERMGYQTGVLSFVVKGVSVQDFINPDTEITVLTEDVKHRVYSTSLKISDFLNKGDATVYRTEFSHPNLESGCPAVPNQLNVHVP
jgi:hypothetical protein